MQTGGADSPGIVAQSIAGHGGASGSDYGLLAYGATGGSAGSGGYAGISSLAGVTTISDRAPALAAQSIGGGGGTGGAAVSAVPNISAKQYSLATKVLVGGKGGVALSNAGFLMNSSKAGTLSFAIGGKGGGGNDGGTVSVTNNQQLQTSGDSAYGIFAQSVGGGGGDGGSAFTYTLGKNEGKGTLQAELALTLGGEGGASGNGAAVTVNNHQTILTSGGDSMGIFAQSVGGAGGTGGNASTLSTLPLTTFGLEVGGKGGAAGDGGMVKITHGDWGILTGGQGASAIYAQSVGGGGGRGGVGVLSDSFTIPAPNDGGSSGDGGKVQMYLAYSTLATQGADAHAVWAQSVGGGGGQTGGLGVGIVDWFFGDTPIPMGTKLGGGGIDSTGRGGMIDLKLEAASVVTRGDNAIAIFAQSVGGGGGLSGLPSDGCTGKCAFTVGSTRGTGDSGDITIDITGNALTHIQTSGRYSHAIFAQSAAGEESDAGSVFVTVDVPVTATGEDASAIFAQSAGERRNHQIVVAVSENGIVSGGYGNAAGVRLVDGTGNGIENHGTITSVLGAQGVAIRVDTSTGATAHPKTTVYNDGTIIGDVLAGGGASITLMSETDATLVAGSRMLLGPEGQLENRGVMEVGRAGSGQVRLEGDLVQDATGRLVYDLTPGATGHPGGADLLDITGHATLAGTVQMRLLGFGAGQDGPHAIPLVKAGADLDAGDLHVQPSALAQFRLEAGPTPGIVALNYDIDFVNASVTGHLDRTQLALARHLDGLHAAGAVPGALVWLGGAADAAAYGRGLDHLSPEAYATSLWATGQVARRFGGALLDCRDAGIRTSAEGSCIGLNFGLWDGSGTGFDFDGRQMVVQAEARLDDDWTVGGGLGHIFANDVDAASGIWHGEGTLTQAGLYLRRDFGPAALTAALFAGRGHSDVTRLIAGNDATQGRLDLRYFSGLLRGERDFALGGGTLRAGLDLAATRIESGGPGRLTVKEVHDTTVSLRPHVEWSHETTLDDGLVLRSGIGFGMTRYLDEPAPIVSASLSEGAGIAPPMLVGADVPDTWGDLSLGLTATRQDGASLAVSLDGSFAHGYHDIGAGLRLRIPF